MVGERQGCYGALDIARGADVRMAAAERNPLNLIRFAPA
jgi:hypothetical protein